MWLQSTEGAPSEDTSEQSSQADQVRFVKYHKILSDLWEGPSKQSTVLARNVCAECHGGVAFGVIWCTPGITTAGACQSYSNEIFDAMYRPALCALPSWFDS